MEELHSLRAYLPLLLLFAVSCSGTQPKQAGDENYFDTAPTGDSTGDSSESSSSDVSSGSDEGGGLNSDQKKQMEIALRRGGEKASNCAEVVPDAPTGEGEVKVVFDGKKGRAVDVIVVPPFAGTPAEACIKRAFIGEIVLPFDGEPLEVPYTVKLTKKGAAPAEKKKQP